MIIGITGGIASGKSEVCRILEEQGFYHIDADDVAHKVLGFPDVIEKITSAFGNTVLKKDDESAETSIDRSKLGKIVFNDPAKMEILENITHPYIVEEIQSIINNNDNCVIEAIKLVSSGLINICDELWIVAAEPEQQMERLMNNRHLSYHEAKARLDAQKQHDWDESKADRIIHSIEPIASMKAQVLEALEKSYNSRDL